ncbi:unnamed protein product [Ilex paraguariensis]|uniref:Uncharacterized protein n=1 Tax=Ilex paraguariensis TaxID=185542 RepID=A0ABC8TVB7_9AQUA
MILWQHTGGSNWSFLIWARTDLIWCISDSASKPLVPYRTPFAGSSKIQGCALRGRDKSVMSKNRGNLIEMISLMAKLNVQINDVVLEKVLGNANVSHKRHTELRSAEATEIERGITSGERETDAGANQMSTLHRAATSLLFLDFSFSLYGYFVGFSSNGMFVFSVLNILICAILAISFQPSADDIDAFFPFLFVYGVGKDQTEEIHDASEGCSSPGSIISYYNNGDDDNDEIVDIYYLDGYEEDDDDNGSDGEIGWNDDDEKEEEYDENFESRIEEFIAKVINGWREELLMEKPEIWMG